MQKVAYLKYRDTMPALLVTLKNPDGTIHDLTGSTAWYLHIWLQDGTKLSGARAMTIVGSPTLGVLRYQWVSGDWNAGQLVPGRRHRMEYEVIGPGAARLTFPNGEASDAYDRLSISDDIGQGA